MEAVDHKVRELFVACPRLRRDVRTHFQEFQGKPSYVVEDTARGKYYKIGFPEHQFVQCLDGRTPVARALARNAATQGEDALTERQAEQLVRWLSDHDLLETETSGQGERRREQAARSESKKPQRLLAKLIFLRVPLGCPDRIFRQVTPWFGWIFSAPGLLLWLGLLAYTGIQLAPEWDRFVEASGRIIAPDNWIRIVFIYAVLKILHEFGHGIATRRFGGEVPEWGVMLLVWITPMAFVDASASWRFPSRWRRIVVSAAGMYVEVALACLCILGWLHTGPGVLQTSLHSAVIAATVMTILFNANPLMRFDGYYILVDVLGIPNLGTKGQQFLRWFGKRFLLGAKGLPFPQQARRHPVAIPLYGLLAALWKLVIWTGILITLSLFFKGAGLAIALALVLSMICGGLFQLVRMLAEKGKSPTFSTALPRLAVLVTVLAAIGYFVRINPTGRAVAVVEYLDKETVRVGCEGFVSVVKVKPGEGVIRGQLLVQLRNPDLESSLAQLELELRQSRVRARRYFQRNELSAFQAEQETIAGLEEKLCETREYVSQLQVRAPVDGFVVGRGLDSLPGRWQKLGSPILEIAPSPERELLVSFRQRDIGSIQRRTDDGVRIRLRGRSEEIGGVLERVETRATLAVPHDVLISPNGGPLPIRARAEAETTRETEIASGGDADRDYFADLDEQPDQFELVRPRFAARAAIFGEIENDLMEGEWGYLRLSRAEKERLAVWLYEEISAFLRGKWEQAKMAG